MNKPSLASQVINNRYRILYPLGQGGSGITYAALDLQTQQEVALKMLALHHLDDWKRIELFEREGKILQQLNHPAIPQYLDYFEVETETECHFYLVQKLVPGKSLATLVESGWRPNEATVKDIAKQILTILIYLQQQIPPVIHRDIKPQNIIYYQSENNPQQPGTIYLVDFGSVKDTYQQMLTDGTVVGTYGYMAPEQFLGNAAINTDLYGLGTTLIFLLTGQHPTELPQKNFKYQYQKYAKVSRKFSKWLDKLIEPKKENRLENAQQALDTLQAKKGLGKNLNLEITQESEEIKITFLPTRIFDITDNIKIYLSLLFDGVFFLLLFSLANNIYLKSFLVLYIVFDYLPFECKFKNNPCFIFLKLIPIIIISTYYYSYISYSLQKVESILSIVFFIVVSAFSLMILLVLVSPFIKNEVLRFKICLVNSMLILHLVYNFNFTILWILYLIFNIKTPIHKMYGRKFLFKIKLWLKKDKIIIKEYFLGKKLREYAFSLDNHLIDFFSKSKEMKIVYQGNENNGDFKYSLFLPKNEFQKVKSEVEMMLSKYGDIDTK